MAVASSHSRLLTLTARQSDLEYKISTIMSQMQCLSNQNSALMTEKYAEMAKMYNYDSDSEDAQAVYEEMSSEIESQYDVQMAELEAAQERLDLEQAKAETQHKAVVAEKESVQKTVDKSIETEFKHFD